MLRNLFILLGLALMPALAAAQAPRSVTIGRGDSIVVHVAPDGTLWAAAPTAAPPINGFEASALAQMQATPLADSQVQPAIPVQHGPDAPPIKAGQVRIILRTVAPSVDYPKGEMLLSLENGYDGALRYRAVLRSGDRSMPTDVCIVIPHRFGFEHWPFPFERIELSDLQVVPWHAGDSVSCE
ncbi:MAG: hypothetical protein QOJ94_979 [Sphingomonadales bacterium]|jgi:hypothetical protein|nr:hypothetical protein [Sphingomonadales bacterium]